MTNQEQEERFHFHHRLFHSWMKTVFVVPAVQHVLCYRCFIHVISVPGNWNMAQDQKQCFGSHCIIWFACILQSTAENVTSGSVQITMSVTCEHTPLLVQHGHPCQPNLIGKLDTHINNNFPDILMMLYLVSDGYWFVQVFNNYDCACGYDLWGVLLVLYKLEVSLIYLSFACSYKQCETVPPESQW